MIMTNKDVKYITKQIKNTIGIFKSFPFNKVKKLSTVINTLESILKQINE